MTETVETARLMDAVYQHQRHFYDLTRKYYLLGRDRLIADLDPPAGGKVLELGCGTGRNLIAAAKRYPSVQFVGLDISQHMLETASRNIRKAGFEDRITLVEGDASNPVALDASGAQVFDRVFYSYTLSMIPVWREALAAGASRLRPDGKLYVVDFGQQERLPQWFKTALFKWLGSFHVSPRPELEDELSMLARKHGLKLTHKALYRGYALFAALCKD
ncbi:methyltransferase domain-containing protein [Roseibium denhamense]|uniref:S-adenosylmethionine-diacylgycerolhomoserine-N-methlytransferase n=1 Tax=Roseibium denhamense TaxID=76305 RepID=A0ABY1P5X4_9HYPH|nr:class I SAM-dependent methyltransferase [Roseibium denhamense]MTI05202.1 methyltransferase domain-containing protein [Roseibium denhamense]SMP25747.1 S-adenosylmethionine-diacylgycerolhomoserine-N-methlytransferase [Roseibium denhamense]